MTVYGNYNVIAFKSCIQIFTVYHLGPLGEVRGPKIFIRCRVYRQKLCDFDVRDFLFEPIDVICMFEEASIEMSCINKEA